MPDRLWLPTTFVEPYLRSVLRFLAVTEVTFGTAGGTARLMTAAIDRETLLQPVLEQVRTVPA
jgi:FMN-dependent NADH-azoreductase